MYLYLIILTNPILNHLNIQFKLAPWKVISNINRYINTILNSIMTRFLSSTIHPPWTRQRSEQEQSGHRDFIYANSSIWWRVVHRDFGPLTCFPFFVIGKAANEPKSAPHLPRLTLPPLISPTTCYILIWWRCPSSMNFNKFNLCF